MKFAALLLVLMLSFEPPRCCLNIDDGEVIEIWYCDGPFGAPWIPRWVTAVAYGNTLHQIDGGLNFDARHVKQHLRWRRTGVRHKRHVIGK